MERLIGEQGKGIQDLLVGTIVGNGDMGHEEIHQDGLILKVESGDGMRQINTIPLVIGTLIHGHTGIPRGKTYSHNLNDMHEYFVNAECFKKAIWCW